MAQRWDFNPEAQITPKMHELIGCTCVVRFGKDGDRRGIIEQIESLILGKDFQRASTGASSKYISPRAT